MQRAGAAWIVACGWLAGAACGAPSAAPCAGDACNAVQADPATTAIVRVNHWRTAAGLGSVQAQTQIQAAAQAHAHFMASNPASCWPGSHSETMGPGCVGFTGGQLSDRIDHVGYSWSAVGEAIFQNVTDPVAAVDGWVWSVYHRLIVLDPLVSDAGFAAEGNASVLDLAAPLTDPVTPAAAPLIFPSDGLTEVPLTWDATHESPQAPAPPDGWPSGPPLWVHFPSEQWRLTRVTVTQAGNDVPTTSLTADSDANLAAFSKKELFFYASRPLLAATSYSVTVEATIDTHPWSRTWSFTTKGQ
jgi:uncharacterized protein YkwD